MGQRAGAGGAELGDRPWEGAVFGLSRPPPAPARLLSMTDGFGAVSTPPQLHSTP